MPRLDRGGVRIAWESHGDGTPPILLLPTWSIAPSRMWKLQVSVLDADASDPERLAQELAAALAEPVAYRPVAGDGAPRAASLIAELL